MTHGRRLLISVTALALACLAGCQKGAATPKEALGNFVRSLASGNKDLFLRSTTGMPREQAVAVFELGSAHVDFATSFESAYGKDALGPGKPLFGILTAQDIQALEVREDGNTARFSAPAPSILYPQQFRKEGDRWLVDLSGLPIWGDANRLPELCGPMARAIRESKEFIGKEGYTPEKVLREGAARMWESMAAVALAETDLPSSQRREVEARIAAKCASLRRDDETAPVPAVPAARVTADRTPQEKVAYALEHFGPELRLIRKHPWSRTPGANVQQAVRKAFRSTGAEGTGDGGSRADGVDLVGLSSAQVRSLIGNPSGTSKAARNGETLWSYSYKAAGLSLQLAFRGDQVTRATFQDASPPAIARSGIP